MEQNGDERKTTTLKLGVTSQLLKGPFEIHELNKRNKPRVIGPWWSVV